MLKRMECPNGHYWEIEGQVGPNVDDVVCPVCGNVSELLPNLEFVVSASSEPIEEDLPILDEYREPNIPGYKILQELEPTIHGVRRFRSTQTVTQRDVLLEIVFANEDPGQTAWGSLRAESRILGAVDHSNIQSIFDAGERGRELFYNVVEPVDSESLADLLTDAPADPEEAVRLVRCLADAMDAIHSTGNLHRSIKPTSVMMVPRSEGSIPFAGGTYQPVLVDFGLAYRKPVPSELTDAEFQAKLPEYLSPEQARGDAPVIGPAADIYALGAILYRLLTGRAPHSARTPVQMLLAIQEKKVEPARKVCSKIPKELESICALALAKFPKQRYETAHALSEDLTHFLDGDPVEAHDESYLRSLWKWPGRHPRFTTLVLGAALGVLLVLLAVKFEAIGWHSAAEARDIDELRNQLEQTSLEAFQSKSVAEKRARYLRYASLLRNMVNKQPNLTASADRFLSKVPAEARHWEWHYLSTVVRGKSPPFVDRFQHGVSDLAISPDDRLLAVAYGESSPKPRVVLFELSAHWGMTVRSGLQAFIGPVTKLAFSPDGKRLATLAVDRARRQTQVLEWPAENTRGRPSGSIEQGLVASDIEYDHDGTLLVYDGVSKIYANIEIPGLNEQLQLAASDPQHSPRNKPTPPTSSAEFVPIGRGLRQVFCIQAPGRRLWTNRSVSDKWKLEHRSEPVTFFDLASSPTNNLVACARRDGIVELFTFPETRVELRNLVVPGSDLVAIDLTESGPRLATATLDGTVRIWDPELLEEIVSVRLPAPVSRLAFSPSGRILAIAHQDRVTLLGRIE